MVFAIINIHKNVVTILIQPAIQSFDENDWTYTENLTRPYSIWIKFQGAVQPSIDINAPFSASSQNLMIRIKGNITFDGGLNLFENLDLSEANINLKDTFDAVSCRVGKITKLGGSQSTCRLKDCRGSGTITMNTGYLLLDNFVNCSDDKSVNVVINGGSGVKMLNSSGINLQTFATNIKPYIEATNTYFKGFNIGNASYVTLVGGGAIERLGTTNPSYSLNGIKIEKGIPYSITAFSYDQFRSSL